ncbi:MAG TPA: type II toxin-antitoxin system VapC family toxin [Pyrinomonadaceae bacterium]|nr:type II toxin-antitoxin system VapC family toxin [Pyrinomonadaceae bacterium]
MVAYFLDSSALVKRYATETGTAWMTGLIEPSAGNLIYIARITGVETVAAIARKRKGNLLSPADASTALATLRTELAGLFLIVEVTTVLLATALDLADKHALRGYDAVQLAATLSANSERLQQNLPPLVLVTADTDLLVAGAAEGLATDDPNTH